MEAIFVDLNSCIITMPPRKKIKGSKSGEGASSSAPSFDSHRFWDETAAANYVKLLEKSMHRERGMDQSHPNCDTLTLAAEMNWGEFVKPPSDAVLSLVREFYANLKVKHEDYHVRIRGKMVAFDRQSINAMFSIPELDFEHYSFFQSEAYPYEDVINTLCVPGTVWKLNNQRAPITFAATSLKSEAYNWYHFVASRILPSGHVSDVTKSRAGLVYCILKRKTIDAGRVIMHSILQASRGTSTVIMPHSSTITDLCSRAGVTWDDSEQLLQIKRDIIVYVPVTRHQRGKPPPRGTRRPTGREASGSRAPPRALPQPTEEAPPAHDDTKQSFHERFDDMERMMRMQWQISREHFDYVHDFHAVLASRFPPSTATDAPFPQPPTWSHTPVEDDYEYDDDEDEEEQDVDSES